MEPKRNKWFFYSPGLISLIGLPVLCLFFIIKTGRLERPHCLPIAWMESEIKVQEDPWGFMRDIYHSIHTRKYHEFLLTDDVINNKQALLAASLDVRELQRSRSLKTGVHFVFRDDCPFEFLIAAIDICKMAKIRSYAPSENDLWVLNPDPPKPEKDDHKYLSSCAGVSCCVIHLPDPNAEELARKEEDIKHCEIIRAQFTYYKPLIVLFLILAFVGILGQQFRPEDR